MEDQWKLETLAVHAGVEPDPSTGAIMTPIFATSTYVQESPGKHRGFEYSRTGNPTRRALETAVAAIEGGAHGLAFASGCAATDAVLHLLNVGDHVVSVDDVYGGTSRTLRTVWSRHGIETTFADLATKSITEFLKPNTKIVWLETPTNPTLKVIDVARVAEDLRKVSPEPLLVVDNTFASPCFQRPFDLGADIVLHSTTKYLNGHSDVVGGALIVNDRALRDRLHHIQNTTGGVCGPFDAWLVMRGLKTLSVRMRQAGENAMEIASFLEKHPSVERVLYPGLPSHPQHSVAKKQMSAFGGIITFYRKGGISQARKFLESVKVFALAESLGGVESLVEHPAIMTHASLPAETRQKLGISDSLVRLSIGIEHVSDLKADLDQALKVSDHV